MRTKIWIGVGLAIAAQAGGATAGTEGGAVRIVTSGPPKAERAGLPGLPIAPAPATYRLAASGEGGEAGAAAAKDHPFGLAVLDGATPEVATAVHLMMMRAHLQTAMALFDAGQAKSARKHARLPAEDHYGYVRGELAEYGVAGFKAQLRAFEKALARKEDAEAVKAALDSAMTAIDKARQSIPAATRDTPAFAADVFVRLVKRAGEELNDAYAGGALSNGEDYRIARGYLLSAEAALSDDKDLLSKKDAAGFATLGADLASLAAATTALDAPSALTPPLEKIMASVSHIELTASRFMR